jgi:hypothetical protein
MSNGSPAPATAFSAYSQPDTDPSTLWLGGRNYYPPIQTADESCIWLAVVDLSDLSVVANQVSDGQSVPSEIEAYVGNPQFFLYVISNAAWASQMPQGDLYALLDQVGAGPQLARLEQIYSTIGTGFLGAFSYILAATMTKNDDSGFETLSLTNMTVLTMGFLPVTVNGSTVYAPVQGSAG